jgi:acetyl-CoA C-acetyltransferase
MRNARRRTSPAGVGNTGTRQCRAGPPPPSGRPTAYAVTLIANALGLDAILDAIRRVSAEIGDVGIGGAESLRPRRGIARRRTPTRPHFTGYRAPEWSRRRPGRGIRGRRGSARKLGISRQAGRFVVQSQLVAEQARERRQFIGEIAGARATPEEMRDQSGAQLELEDLKELPPYHAPEGTVTAGNSSTLADGAAFAVVVSGSVWAALGRPKGLALVRSLACGVAPANAAGAGIFALDALLQRGVDKAARDVASLAAIETCEASPPRRWP